jgi:very-short-patch-repair endonuclease
MAESDVTSRIYIKKRNCCNTQELNRERIKIKRRCQIRKCKNMAYEISSRYLSKFCYDHLKNMERDCIVRGCKNEPFYGIDKKVILCQHHSDGYELTRDYTCQYGGGVRKICKEKHCTVCFYRTLESNSYAAERWNSDNIFSPREVCLRSDKKIILDCDICDHSFETTGNYLMRGSSCPFCSSKKLCNENDCSFCFNKSFASTIVGNESFWSDKNKLTARQVFKNSMKEIYVNCDICKHIFISIPNRLIKSMTNGCSYCNSKILCNEPDCLLCFEKSLASEIQITKKWSNKNKIKPREVFKYSNNKHWFDCDICYHSYFKVVSLIHKSGCPYCGPGYKIVCGKYNCDHCYNNSLASVIFDSYWSTKNNIQIINVLKYSNKKYWFNCENGHEFKTTPSSITYGSWCSKCKNKTESMLIDFFKNYLTEKVVYQSKFDWCRLTRFLPFDFYIPSLDLIIELDGQQHFSQVSSWKSPDDTRCNDVYKMKRALENGITVIRILQKDIYYSKYDDWESLLKSQLYKRDIPTIVYLDNGTGLYKQHTEDMKDL